MLICSGCYFFLLESSIENVKFHIDSTKSFSISYKNILARNVLSFFTLVNADNFERSNSKILCILYFMVNCMADMQYESTLYWNVRYDIQKLNETLFIYSKRKHCAVHAI